MTSNEFWQNKIKAFLHDPPDKAVYLRKRDENQRGHEDRRDTLLQVLGLEFDIDETFDYWSASMQRVTIPTKDFWIDFHRTDRKEHPYFIHTISADDKKYEKISNSVLGTQKMRTFQVLDKVLEIEKEVLNELKDEDYKRMYFKIWRFFKELLEERLNKKMDGISQELVNLPADTRCPDHTIWDHLDISSAIYGAMKKGTPALLLFKISPVQSFISAARKEKDLWAGSHLLSYITFKAIMVVVEKYGPDSIVFPHLRSQPLFDLEKFPTGDLVNEKLGEKVKVANIPNRFLAIVNYGDFKSLKIEIERTVGETLESIANKALNEIECPDDTKESALSVVREYFNVTVEALRVKEELKNYAEFIDFVNRLELPAKTKEKYVEWLKILEELSGYSARPFDIDGLMFEILEAVVGYESSKFQKSTQPSGYKCTMCGQLNAINGEDYKVMKKFWDERAKKIDEIKHGERLCPLCLMKRYYSKWFENLFKDKTGGRIDVGFESVVNVAMAKTVNGVKYYKNFESHSEYSNFQSGLSSFFLKLAERIGSSDPLLAGKFLREAKNVSEKARINKQMYYVERLNLKSILSDFGIDKELKAELEKDEQLNKSISDLRELVREKIHKEIAGNSEQPKYYAILVMDGDDMGKLLAGEEMKPFHEYLHNEIQKRVRDRIQKSNVKRPLTPSIHIAISRALMNFSVNKVRKIVDKNNGKLIYAGGDDVLALLPVDKALKCAYEIQAEFNKRFDGWELLPAKTMSAGIIIVHYLHPLHDALERARELEKIAKDSGKNAFFIGFLTRGGQYAVAGAKWTILESEGLQTTVKLLQEDKISKRFVYDLLSNAESVPEEAIDSYIAYELSRHYKDYTRELAEKLVKCQDYVLVRETIRLSTRLKSLATLLKILIECDADIGGVGE